MSLSGPYEGGASSAYSNEGELAKQKRLEEARARAARGAYSAATPVVGAFFIPPGTSVPRLAPPLQIGNKLVNFRPIQPGDLNTSKLDKPVVLAPVSPSNPLTLPASGTVPVFQVTPLSPGASAAKEGGQVSMPTLPAGLIDTVRDYLKLTPIENYAKNSYGPLPDAVKPVVQPDGSFKPVPVSAIPTGTFIPNPGFSNEVDGEITGDEIPRIPAQSPLDPDFDYGPIEQNTVDYYEEKEEAAKWPYYTGNEPFEESNQYVDAHAVAATQKEISASAVAADVAKPTVSQKITALPPAAKVAGTGALLALLYNFF